MKAAKKLPTKDDMTNALNLGEENKRKRKRLGTYDTGFFISKS